jgi:hypothetical protein
MRSTVPKRNEHRAEDAELDEQARHEDRPGVAGGHALAVRERLEQRREQREVKQRLDHHDDDPDRLAQQEPHLVSERDHRGLQHEPMPPARRAASDR